ncbi:RagB/SusD family nutrient uptake outer membrane protein [Pedobacter gandavensis]|uniref:RagB/SusD family nutrient uptake outer membrane protein n=1 Tax=Pedobacter gandavensis TaxID=2679963 RepID=UPI0024793D16|nr:RagB/SusD family nutrient uptake outer membrane protein [Pedobacter gandavensis]WGQ10434.1 RagB/SusD family nutrient uptake outer membrane protein [Pedobacter gandavensis]
MKKYTKWINLFTLLFLLSSCSKSEFLEMKPTTTIITPTTLSDFQYLLDNTNIQGTSALAQLADDDYFLANEADLANKSITEQNSYIWAKDIYGGTKEIPDWNIPFKNIFYSNAVLEGLVKSDSNSSERGQFLKGWALFNRAYFMYDLTRNFCKSYDESTATTDLGIPIRLKSGIDKLEKRASLQKTFDQIISDLTSAENLLPKTRNSSNLNRPSRIAVYALLARIYLEMRSYVQAEIYADKCLNLYSKLIDYNTLSLTASRPFSITNEELIYNTATVPNYELTSAYSLSPAKVVNSLVQSYDINDLRKTIFFLLNQTNGYYTKKSGYYGLGSYPFSGLATDEIYLIKAECLVRNGMPNLAMDKLNELLITRYSNKSVFIPLRASSNAHALDIILQERRKELVFRGQRWHDLKRLNKEGAQITISRTLLGTRYTLPSNDPRWVFPIPDDEVTLSGIAQNQR